MFKNRRYISHEWIINEQASLEDKSRGNFFIVGLESRLEVVVLSLLKAYNSDFLSNYTWQIVKIIVPTLLFNALIIRICPRNEAYSKPIAKLWSTVATIESVTQYSQIQLWYYFIQKPHVCDVFVVRGGTFRGEAKAKRRK